MRMKACPEGIASYNSLLRTKIDDYLRARLKEVGRDELIPSYGALLSVVYRNGGRVQIKTIYDALLKQKTTVTEMINRLVKLGYLTKEGCPEDRRVTYVSATEKALSFERDFNEISAQLLEKAFRGFSAEEKEFFMRLLARAIDNFN
jgi:DNA-binding MarR family transcriptional regulator